MGVIEQDRLAFLLGGICFVYYLYQGLPIKDRNTC
jgi:hypothetical protein